MRALSWPTWEGARKSMCFVRVPYAVEPEDFTHIRVQLFELSRALTHAPINQQTVLRILPSAVAENIH